MRVCQQLGGGGGGAYPAREANTDASGDVLDATAPDVLVQLDVEADVLGSHRLLGELPDLTDSAGSLALEGPAAVQLGVCIGAH